jgi:inorganic triphosphatase YgiF
VGGGVGAVLETELKFELGAGAAKTLVDHLKLATLGEQRTLRSIYFDTPKNALKSHHFVLRVRDDGVHRVQTVKESTAGSSGFRRGEWEGRIEDQPGEALTPDLASVARTPLGALLKPGDLAQLQPIFEVELDRIGRSVEVDGAVIEIVLDRGCVRAQGRKAPVRELELELKSGPVQGLFSLARELSEVAPMELCFVSKSQRGFALIENKPAVAAEAINPALKPHETAAEAFQTIAGAALAQIVANARVLRVARRMEALHQLRVGARRLRSAISLFGPMLADDGREHVKAELKWLTGQMDQARDLDVFIQETYRPAAERRPDLTGLAAFGHALLTAQDRAYGRVEAAINGARFRALMLEVLAWIEAGAWSEAPKLADLRTRPIKAVASQRLEDHYRKVVKKGRKLARLEPMARHHLRIKAKKLRYACGFFGSLYGGGKDQRAFALAMRDLQDSLGALNDAAVSHAMVARLAGLGKAPGRAACVVDPAAAFAAGAILGETTAGTEGLIKAAVKAHKAVSKAKPYW